nr:ZPR1 zinc finger domain-containing protein [Methanobrevibacter curvatus]
MNGDKMTKMIIDCPVCGNLKSAEYTTHTDEIPYFGEIMEATVKCNECGYKHNDVIVLEQKEPVKFELKINKYNLSSRIIKSPSATVYIPELGLKVEPGPKSKAYVSNVEGVIIRFEDAIKRALALFEDDESQKNAKIILKQLENLLKGEEKGTLVIDDPFGQSQIIDLKAKKRTLNEEELKDLKTGFTVIE